VSSSLLNPVHNLQELKQVLDEAGYSSQEKASAPGQACLEVRVPETDLHLDIRPGTSLLEDRWEFYLACPVSIPDSRFASLAELLSDFNRLLPWGSTGLAEDDTPYFHWSPTAALSTMTGIHLLELVQMVLFFGRQLSLQMRDLLRQLSMAEITTPALS